LIITVTFAFSSFAFYTHIRIIPLSHFIHVHFRTFALSHFITSFPGLPLYLCLKKTTDHFWWPQSTIHSCRKNTTDHYSTALTSQITSDEWRPQITVYQPQKTITIVQYYLHTLIQSNICIFLCVICGDLSWSAVFRQPRYSEYPLFRLGLGIRVRMAYVWNSGPSE